MKYISIAPIFNQCSPSIWSTFADIQGAAMYGIYKYKNAPAEIAFNISQLSAVWNRAPCFAFAAYDIYDNKMVGYIHGCVGQPYATVNGLYVLPKYRTRGIGSKLLTASEQSVSIYADMMRLTALWQSKKFYQANGYRIVSARDGLCEKRININGGNQIVPMFVCSNKIARLCDNIAKIYNMRFDASNINKKHLPMFVYLNESMEPDGYILAEQNTPRLYIKNFARYDIVYRLIENMATLNER